MFVERKKNLYIVQANFKQFTIFLVFVEEIAINSYNPLYENCSKNLYMTKKK